MLLVPAVIGIAAAAPLLLDGCFGRGAANLPRRGVRRNPDRRSTDGASLSANFRAANSAPSCQTGRTRRWPGVLPEMSPVPDALPGPVQAAGLSQDEDCSPGVPARQPAICLVWITPDGHKRPRRGTNRASAARTVLLSKRLGVRCIDPRGRTRNLHVRGISQRAKSPGSRGGQPVRKPALAIRHTGMVR